MVIISGFGQAFLLRSLAASSLEHLASGETVFANFAGSEALGAPLSFPASFVHEVNSRGPLNSLRLMADSLRSRCKFLSRCCHASWMGGWMNGWPTRSLSLPRWVSGGTWSRLCNTGFPGSPGTHQFLSFPFLEAVFLRFFFFFFFFYYLAFFNVILFYVSTSTAAFEFLAWKQLALRSFSFTPSFPEV